MTLTAQGGVIGIASAFVMQSLNHIIVWLIVMFFVIVCDLVCGLRKSYIMHKDIRFSKAIRLTLSKMVTYFAFVVMVCLIQVASEMSFKMDVYACLLVCIIEGISIISNILKPKGINISFVDVLRYMGKRFAKVDKADLDEIIKEDKHNEIL